MSKTDEELVADGNALAREFYRLMGYVVPEGYRFDKAKHPQETRCWTMACVAYERLTDTDLDDALASTE